MENSMPYSLSDIEAVTGGKDGFGGNWVLILLFAMIFGFGGNGFGGRGSYGDYATAASQQDILFGQKFSDLDNKMDRLGNGIADATFALNNSVTNEGRAMQSQLAECCCSNKEAIAQVRYDMANFNAQTNANIDAKFAALEKAQLEQTIKNLEGQVNQLNLSNQLCGVMRYPTAPAYAYSLPAANCGCGGNNI